jgi:hypothetical protein
MRYVFSNLKLLLFILSLFVAGIALLVGRGIDGRLTIPLSRAQIFLLDGLLAFLYLVASGPLDNQTHCPGGIRAGPHGHTRFLFLALLPGDVPIGPHPSELFCDYGYLEICSKLFGQTGKVTIKAFICVTLLTYKSRQ